MLRCRKVRADAIGDFGELLGRQKARVATREFRGGSRKGNVKIS